MDADPDICTGIHPFACVARASAEDTPRYHKAMKSADREGFIEAMKKEMDQLASLDVFIAVPCQKAVGEGRQIIDTTWTLDGSVKKLKARLCIRGDQSYSWYLGMSSF